MLLFRKRNFALFIPILITMLVLFTFYVDKEFFASELLNVAIFIFSSLIPVLFIMGLTLESKNAHNHSNEKDDTPTNQKELFKKEVKQTLLDPYYIFTVGISGVILFFTLSYSATESTQFVSIFSAYIITHIMLVFAVYIFKYSFKNRFRDIVAVLGMFMLAQPMLTVVKFEEKTKEIILALMPNVSLFEMFSSHQIVQLLAIATFTATLIFMGFLYKRKIAVV